MSIGTMEMRQRLNITDQHCKRADELVVGDRFLDFGWHDDVPFWAEVVEVTQCGEDVEIVTLGEEDGFGWRRREEFFTSGGNTFVIGKFPDQRNQ